MLANSPLLSVCELNSNAQRIGFWYGYKIKSSLIKKYHSDLTQPRNTYIHRMIPSFFRWEYYIRKISTKKPFSSRIRYCFMNCHIAWCRYKQSHQNTYNDLIWLRSNNFYLTLKAGSLVILTNGKMLVCICLTICSTKTRLNCSDTSACDCVPYLQVFDAEGNNFLDPWRHQVVTWINTGTCVRSTDVGNCYTFTLS